MKPIASSIAIAAIVVALVVGLGAGYFATTSIGISTSTQTLVTTQTLVSTLTPVVANPIVVTSTQTNTVTQTQTNTQTTTAIIVSTTTQTQTNTVVSIQTQSVTVTDTSAVNSLQSIVSGQDSSVLQTNYPYPVPSQSTYPITNVGTLQYPYSGYLQIVFQAGNTMHWQLTGNGIVENSPSSVTSGTVYFPIALNTAYSLSIINDHCGVLGCGSSFTVTASITFIY